MKVPVAIAAVARILFGAALCAGCTAPLILAEEPGIDAPLVPALPGSDAEATDAAGEDPQISVLDGGADADEDAPFADPNNADDGGSGKPMLDGSAKDAGGR
jgi:hypothetical protein